MSLLLDTHALLWWLADAPLDDEAARHIRDPDVLVVVSAVSMWEAAIKRQLGKLELGDGVVLADEAVEAGFEPLAIDLAHAERAGALPPLHRDPFDRMLVAQAQLEGLRLVTRDQQLAAYDVPVLAC